MSKPVFLSASWRHICLFNYEIDPDILLPHIPFKTELDFYEGKTYVSLVAFMFYRTKAFGFVPAFFHETFEEINLRFYVLRKEGGSIKRGVVFIKEVVPKPILAWIARQFYNENYVAMPTKNRINPGKVYEYEWGVNKIRVEADGKIISPAEHSHERWITEHYWGYTKLRPDRTYEYEVQHPVWNLYGVERHELSADVERLYGKEFVPVFANRPTSVFLAEGSEITVHFPSLIT